MANLVNLIYAEEVHDLDSRSHLSDLTSSGIDLSNNKPTTHLKISSNDGSTGYSWIIDFEECAGIIDITSAYVSFQEDSSDFITGLGEEVFTLAAV